MIGRPFCDLFFQDRFLIPGIDLRIEFERSSPEFCLISTTDITGKFVVEIQQAKLKVYKNTLYPSIMQSHARLLGSGKTIQMPMRRVECKSLTIVPGTLQLYNESLLQGLLPARIVIGLVKSKYQIGTLEFSPFLFENHDLKQINVTINGDQVTTSPIEMDYSSNQFLEAYYNLFQGLGIENDDIGLDLTLDQFRETFAVYLYNLAQVKDGFTPPSFGVLKLELKFNKAPTDALTCIVYCEYVSILTIDNNRTVSFRDFAAEK